MKYHIALIHIVARGIFVAVSPVFITNNNAAGIHQRRCV
jgi:hypothetical protein